MNWREQAACKGLTRLFYPGQGETTSEAIAVCRTCPVQPQCLNDALINGERFGIWGGKSEKQRKRTRALMPRPIEHGTAAGHAAHIRRGDDPCHQCVDAYNAHRAEYKRTRRWRAA